MQPLTSWLPLIEAHALLTAFVAGLVVLVAWAALRWSGRIVAWLGRTCKRLLRLHTPRTAMQPHDPQIEEEQRHSVTLRAGEVARRWVGRGLAGLDIAMPHGARVAVVAHGRVQFHLDTDTYTPAEFRGHLEKANATGSGVQVCMYRIEGHRVEVTFERLKSHDGFDDVAACLKLDVCFQGATVDDEMAHVSSAFHRCGGGSQRELIDQKILGDRVAEILRSAMMTATAQRPMADLLWPVGFDGDLRGTLDCLPAKFGLAAMFGDVTFRSEMKALETSRRWVAFVRDLEKRGVIESVRDEAELRDLGGLFAHEAHLRDLDRLKEQYDREQWLRAHTGLRFVPPQVEPVSRQPPLHPTPAPTPAAPPAPAVPPGRSTEPQGAGTPPGKRASRHAGDARSRVVVKAVAGNVTLRVTTGPTHFDGQCSASPGSVGRTLTFRNAEGTLLVGDDPLVELQVESLSGSIDGDVADPGVIKTQSGDIDLQVVAPLSLSARTQSGTTSIRGMKQVGSGEWRTDGREPAGRLELQTASGDIRVRCGEVAGHGTQPPTAETRSLVDVHDMLMRDDQDEKATLSRHLDSLRSRQ